MKSAVIFDMDGTIWDSSDQVAESWLQVFSKYGLYGITKKNVQDCMGLVMNDIFDRLLPGADEPFRRKIQKECEENENAYLAVHSGRVYDGLFECVSELKKAGHLVMIVTNAQDGYVQSFLSANGAQDLFDDYEMYGRTGFLKKDNIKLIMDRCGVSRAVYVGDTQLDYDSAVSCGCGFVFASYGFGSVSQQVLSAASPLDIPSLAERAFSIYYSEK